MHPSQLGTGILFLHIIPLLSRRSMMAFISTDKTLFKLLGHLRFERTQVRRFRRPGSIEEFLRPSTLRSIYHLELNGTNSDYIAIFRTSTLTNVQSVKITKQITPTQQQDLFAAIAHQLTNLVEIGRFGEMASIAHLPKGSLNRLQTLILQDVNMPPLRDLIANSHGIAASLTTIAFVQADMMFSTRVLEGGYIRNINILLRTLSDSSLVPNLRTVNFSVGRSAPCGPSKERRILLLNAIYTAAATHGGWRLTPTRPCNTTHKEDSDASQCWCSSHIGNFFVTGEEVMQFAQWCEQNGRYARWEDFVDANVHLEVGYAGLDLEKLKLPGTTTSRLADVHGMSVLPGAKLDLETALGAVTGKTRCVLVQLESFWGALDSRVVRQTAGRWDGVRALRVEVMPEHWYSATPTYTRPKEYAKNLSAVVVNCLDIPLWNNLRALSVPAIALQSGDAFPARALCRRHIAAYKFPWLAQCVTLSRFQVTNWMTCVGCYEVYEEAVMELGHLDGGGEFVGGGQSLVDELARNVPAGVREFLINCVFDVTETKVWKADVEIDIRAALGDDVVVKFEHVGLEN